MESTISSRQTFLIKFIFPVVWLAIFLFFIFTSNAVSAAKSNQPKIMLAFIFVMMVTVSYLLFIRLKKVAIAGNSLCVSNYLKEIEIPFSEITDITENVWINIHPVTVYLKTHTEFGGKIIFMPKFRPFAFWSSHPVVEELKQLTAENRF